MPPRPGVAAALLVTTVLLAACGDSETATSTTSSPASSTTIPLDGSTTVTSEDGTTISVTLADGELAGGVQRVTVARDERVTLHVTADESDEVHVHGYDLTADVAPGSPATIEFVADIPGQFEIELHHFGLIVDLTVT